MSYDLGVWEGSPPVSPEAAVAHCEEHLDAENELATHVRASSGGTHHEPPRVPG